MGGTLPCLLRLAFQNLLQEGDAAVAAASQALWGVLLRVLPPASLAAALPPDVLQVGAARLLCHRLPCSSSAACSEAATFHYVPMAGSSVNRHCSWVFLSGQGFMALACTPEGQALPAAALLVVAPPQSQRAKSQPAAGSRNPKPSGSDRDLSPFIVGISHSWSTLQLRDTAGHALGHLSAALAPHAGDADLEVSCCFAGGEGALAPQACDLSAVALDRTTDCRRARALG